jgi:hypothetical protein
MQTINDAPKYRLNLIKTNCEVRDERWSIHLDAGDSPVQMRVYHRKYGDYYDWPGAVFDTKITAALRAYDIQEEVLFYTRGRALNAAHGFLKAYGAGEVEYLEWDVDSQSMVVVGHSGRCEAGLWWPAAKPDPLEQFFSKEAN